MRTSQRIRKILEVTSLDDWTRTFCESILRQVMKGSSLSERQLQILATKEQRYDPRNLKAENEWAFSWDEEKEEIFTVCAMYYKKTGYFSSIIERSMGSEGDIIKIPSKRSYKKMCENKYAAKVRAAWFGEPVYPTGTVVTLRPSATPWTQTTGLPYFVLETNSDYPESACKGAKLYKLLAAGQIVPITVEERHIKKLRRKKQ